MSGISLGSGGNRGRSNTDRRAPGTRHRGHDGFPLLGREMEREAAVAVTVIVAAFEASPFISEQQGAGRQDRSTRRRAVLERAFCYRGDAHRAVPLLERAIMRAGSADDVVHAPTLARGQQMRGDAHARIIAIFPKPHAGAAF